MLTVKKVSLSTIALSLLVVGSTAQASFSTANLKQKALLGLAAAIIVGTYDLYTKDTWKNVPTLAEDADVVETLKFYWNRYWVGQKGRDSVVKARTGADGRTYLVAKKKKAPHGVLGTAQTLFGIGVAPAIAVIGNYNASRNQVVAVLKHFGVNLENVVPTFEDPKPADAQATARN